MKFAIGLGAAAAVVSGVLALNAPPAIPVTFSDVTAQAGIKFVHNAGKAGKKYLPETLGSGAAFIDADGDGWIDILLVNSKDWTPRGRRSTAALYRNNHNGTFTDITRGSGLDIEIYGIGVAVGDYDNDGRDDVYITALDGDHLFHNDGGGKFTRCHEDIRNQQRQLRHQRRLARLRSRRQAGSVRRQLCSVDSKRRHLVFSRWFDEVLLHAGILQRHVEQALPQPRQRQVSKM